MGTRTPWVPAHGEAGRTGHLVLLTVDGLIRASSMVMLDSATEGADTGVGEVASGPGHCGDAGGQQAHGLARRTALH
jgi:hypothetical protein